MEKHDEIKLRLHVAEEFSTEIVDRFTCGIEGIFDLSIIVDEIIQNDGEDRLLKELGVPRLIKYLYSQSYKVKEEE